MKFVALILCLILVVALPASAQLRTDMESEAAFKLINDGKYIEAREFAQKLLAQDKDSALGFYVLGEVYARGESSLPRAHFYLTKAIKTIEQKYTENVPADGPQKLHSLTLFSLIMLAGEMDQYEEELQLLNKYDRVYTSRYRPLGMVAWYGWPLMKLGRLTEAREKVRLSMNSGSVEDRIRGLNTLGALEAAVDHPQESYDVFVQLIEEVKRHHWDPEATFLHNAGEAALALGKFDESERHLLEATKYFDPSSFSNPWELVALLYCGEGRLPEAISAVRKMHQWSFKSDPSLGQQSWAYEQQITAEVLMAAGYNEAALSIIRRILDKPDRRGGVSVHADQSEAGLLLFFREALNLRREELKEEMAWCLPNRWMSNTLEQVGLSREMWTASSRTAALTVRFGRLNWSLRPYGSDTRVTEWLRPSMNQVLGDGVTAAELRRLLERQGLQATRESPYLLLMQGEGALRQGDLRGARENLTKAQSLLPPAEVLLRGRAEALMGLVESRSGDGRAAMTHYERAMAQDPNIIRQLGIRLPVRIEAAGDAASQEAGRMLAHSPRFDNVGFGFTISISPSGDGLQARLATPDGSNLAMAIGKRQADPADTARALCQEFHHKAFLYKVDLSQTDINSIDGSNMSGEAARKQIQDMLNTKGSEPTYKIFEH